MRVKILFIVSFLLLPLISISAPKIEQPPIQKVIYITLDGVRWQDFFDRSQFFKKLWDHYAEGGQIYGGEVPGRLMEVASTPISLPSYQSQMAGMVQPCADNYCGRIQVETFPEKLITTQHWPRKEVAVFSSWSPIEFAAQHIVNTVFTNTGNQPVYDPDDFTEDEVMKVLNEKQANDPHPNHNRRDRYTFAQAMHYLEKYQPKFLWISLVNADDAAHAEDLELYHAMLQYYDEALFELLIYLNNHDGYQHTLVIITTDHGRGNGPDWVRHGPQFPESKRIWAMVLNGSLEQDRTKESQPYYSTLSIRKTIEKIFSNQ